MVDQCEVSSAMYQKPNPRELPHEGLDKAGDNLLSRYSHYHGPQMLNGRVRNGNGCVHLGMVTGKSLGIAGFRLAPAWTLRGLNEYRPADISRR
jgi:hypothetical protein